MTKQIIFLCITLLLSFVFCLDVDVCDENSGIPGAIQFVSKGCDAPPCPLVRGTTSDVNITFRIPEDTDTSTIKIEAKIGPLTVPFPPPDKDTCHNLLNSYCPLDQNEIVTFHLGIAILPLYPKMKMTLKIQFLDEKEKSMMCILVPCEVVDPPSRWAK